MLQPRIITNRESRRQIIDKIHRQRYVALRGILLPCVRMPPVFRIFPASAAIDEKPPSVHPPGKISSEIGRKPWRNRRHSSRASGPT